VSEPLSPLEPESELDSSSLSILVFVSGAGGETWFFFFFGDEDFAGVGLGTPAVTTHEERVKK
jgi:hypothetical protein